MFAVDENSKRTWIIASSAVGLAIIALVVFAIPLMDEETIVIQQHPVTETYYETETRTSIQDKSRNLAADVIFPLTAGKRVFAAEIDLTNKTGAIVSGYFILKDFLLDYTFYVVGEGEYNEHSVYSQIPPDNPYVAIAPGDHNTTNPFSFVPDSSGTYYLVFNTVDESPDFHQGGQVVFGAVWRWQETVVETVQVLKERTVMEEEQVTQHEKVTLWEYLTRD